MLKKLFKARKVHSELWPKLLKVDASVIGSKRRELKQKTILRAIFEIFFYKPDICFDKSHTKFLFFKSLERTDYNTLFREISEACACDKHVVDLRYRRVPIIRIMPLLHLVMLLGPVLLAQPEIRLHCRLDRIYLLIRAVKIYEVVSIVGKADFDRLVVFADMQPIDHALVEHAKKRSIKTITLQHGLYVDYSEYPNINEVNYLHHNADCFLAWGEDTAKLIHKYHGKANTYICGKPIVKTSRGETEKVIAVVFDQNLFFEKNLEMLEIVYRYAHEKNYRVYPKMHPNNHRWRYKKYLDDPITIEAFDIFKTVLAVGHTSSFLYELMALDIPVTRYQTMMPSIETSPELQFTDFESFSRTYANIANSKFDFSNEGMKYLRYIDQESVDQYANFFRSDSY